jgi:hypothetical protein
MFGAVVALSWSSPSQPKQVVPSLRLYPTYGGKCDISSNGLKGEYFDNMNLTNLIAARTDNCINFAWDDIAPMAAMGLDTYSVRWTGKIVPKYTQTYTFYTLTNDGVRLWVNGQLLIDSWINQAAEHSSSIGLTAGQAYDIKVEYYNNAATGVAELSWSSPSQPKEVVQGSRLYPN